MAPSDEDLNEPFPSGKTPYEYALEHKSIELIKILAPKVKNPNAPYSLNDYIPIYFYFFQFSASDVATRSAMLSGFTPAALAFSHPDLAALICVQQKNQYEKFLREQTSAAAIAHQNVVERRDSSTSTKSDDNKGNVNVNFSS